MHPLLQILVLLGLAFAGLCLGSFLALLLIGQLYGYSLAAFGQLSANPGASPHGWAAMMLLQGLTLAGLGAGAAVIPRVVGMPWASSRRDSSSAKTTERWRPPVQPMATVR